MTPRSAAVLKAIVREYAKTGLPVGSLVLTQRYALPYSSATIRSEMSRLEKLGYLSHPHTSAGRIPTEKGYRYYVNLIQEEAAPVRHNQIIQKKIDAMEGNPNRRLDAASQILSELTDTLGFAGTLEGLYSHGLGNLFSYPEIMGDSRATKAADMIDHLASFLRELPDEFDTQVYIGSELPIGKSAGCSIVVSRFEFPGGRCGYLGVIGPTRMSYERGISTVNEVKNVLEENYE